MAKKYLQPKLQGNYNQLLQYNQTISGFNKWEAVDAVITGNGFVPEIRVDSVEGCDVKAVPSYAFPDLNPSLPDTEAILPYKIEDNYYYIKIPTFGTWEVSAEKDGYIDSEIVEVNEIKQYRISLYDLSPTEDFGGKTLYTPTPITLSNLSSSYTIPLGDVYNPILIISNLSTLNYIHFQDSEFLVNSNSNYDARFIQFYTEDLETGVFFYENKNYYSVSSYFHLIGLGTLQHRLLTADDFKFYTSYDYVTLYLAPAQGGHYNYYLVTKDLLRISKKSDSMVPMCTISDNSNQMLLDSSSGSYTTTQGFSEVCKLDDYHYLTAYMTTAPTDTYSLYEVDSSGNNKVFKPVDNQPSGYPLTHALYTQDDGQGTMIFLETGGGWLTHKFNTLFNNNSDILVVDIHPYTYSFFLLDVETYEKKSFSYNYHNWDASSGTATAVQGMLGSSFVFELDNESVFCCTSNAASLFKLSYEESSSYTASSFSLQNITISMPPELSGSGISILSCYKLPDDNILFLIRGASDSSSVLDKKLYITKIVGSSLVILNSYNITDFYPFSPGGSLSLLQISDCNYIFHHAFSSGYSSHYYAPISYYHDKLYKGYLV